jgi:hypothetical protein
MAKVKLTHDYYDNMRLHFRGDIIDIPSDQPVPPSVPVDEELPETLDDPETSEPRKGKKLSDLKEL